MHVVVVCRALSACWLIAFAILGGIKQEVPWLAMGVSGEGCKATNATLESLPTWPSPQRFPEVGCIFAYQAYMNVTLVAVMLMLPYGQVPFFTAAGARTLTGYLCMQLQWNVTAVVARWIAQVVNNGVELSSNPIVNDEIMKRLRLTTRSLSKWQLTELSKKTPYVANYLKTIRASGEILLLSDAWLYTIFIIVPISLALCARKPRPNHGWGETGSIWRSIACRWSCSLPAAKICVCA
jgi:hypothetical protein